MSAPHWVQMPRSRSSPAGWGRGRVWGVAAFAAVLGCADDGAGVGDDEVGEEGCEPAAVEPEGYAASEPLDSPPLDWRTLCPEEDFVGLAGADPLGSIPLEFEVLHPTEAGQWPEGEFPILIFSNGNTQYWDRYDSLHGAFVDAGFIVVNIKSGPMSQTLPRGDRILCTARFVREGFLPGEVGEHWNGRLVFSGASTGGEGAIYAARQYSLLGDAEAGSELLGVATIAPSANQPSLANLQQTQLRSFFGIQGSRDGDVDEKVFAAYDLIRTEGSELAVDKSLVYAHSVGHNDWGGCNPTPPTNVCPTPKAAQLLEDYMIPYLRWLGRSDSSARAPLAQASPGLSEALSEPSLWPESEGQPLVARAFAVGTQRCGSERVVVDSFENMQAQFSDVGAVSLLGFEGVAEGEAAAIAKTPHVTGALRVEWSQPDATIAWEVPEELRADVGARDHLNLRIGFLPTVGAPPECPSSTSPAEARVRLTDGSGVVVEQALSEYSGAFVPDVRVLSIGGQLTCVWNDFMTTARIPMASFCSGAPDFSPSDIAQVELVFDAPTLDPLAVALLDSLEWSSALEDEDQACQP